MVFRQAVATNAPRRRLHPYSSFIRAPPDKARICMSKTKKPKSPDPRTPEQIAARRKRILNLSLVILLITGLSVAYAYIRRYDEQGPLASTEPPVVVLK